MRSLVIILAAPLLAAACSSAPPPQPKTEADAPPAPETPGQKCLALAGAVRERKPDEPAKVGVRHLVVKHKDAKNAPETITRTREEACLRALEARDKMLAGADFDAMVSEYSDEKGAAERRGSLGTVERSELEPAFADAAFELSIQQMSDVVETDRGFHLILRTE